MWALATLAETIVMFISGKIIARFGALNILAFSSAFVTIRLLIYALFPFKGGIICAQLLHCFCYGLFHPAAVVFISNSVPPEHRAMGMSLYLSLGTGLPALIGNAMGGFIIEHSGYLALFKIFSLFPIGALGIFISIFIAKNHKRGYAVNNTGEKEQ
jgi:PPP family 3-phenylpropionic acid transporter